MIDHSVHTKDAYGECGQQWGSCWWPDYKWWYARVGGQTGRWYMKWKDRMQLPGFPKDAEELSHTILPPGQTE